MGPLYLAVGRVIVVAAQLEYWLSNILVELVGGNAKYVVQGQPIGVTLDSIVTMVKALDVPDEILALVTTAKGLFQRRDQLAHAIWSGAPDDPSIESIRLRRHGEYTLRTFTPEDLGSLADEIVDCGTLVNNAWGKLLQ